jgi:hypothetical protein
MARELPRNHAFLIGLVVVVVALCFARVSGAWFCGYDDFNEAHRAAFADPKYVLTSTHDLPYMYRPVTSGLQYLTWTAFHHSPLAFRLRNLLAHLVSVAMLYGIVWLIAQSRLIAGGSALLFGLHPMANETVVVAIWTNATAYALFFTSFFLFLYSQRLMRASRRWGLPLAGSMLCALVAIFTYEPTVAIFALMAGYLWMRKNTLSRSYVTAVTACAVLILLVFFGVRHLIIPHGAPLNTVMTILRNITMYGVALILPIDFVFANAVLGTPLPSELHIGGAALLAIVAVLGAATVLVAVRGRGVRRWIANNDWSVPLYLAATIPITAVPLLLFREHPSEHDLYPAAALYAALLSIVLWKVTRSQSVYGAFVACLAVSFIAAAWVRNERVVQCAQIAQRIMTQLPVARWHDGTWHILLATPLQNRLSEPYGIYNDFGLHALETENGVTPGAQEAVQIAANNPRITVRVVDAETLRKNCIGEYRCFWVSEWGSVQEAMPAVSDRASR